VSGASLLLVTVNVVPVSQILVTLMMEMLRSSETLILTRATPRNMQEDGILHSRRGENLKSYNCLNCSPKCSPKSLEIKLLFNDVIKIVLNEIIHGHFNTQCYDTVLRLTNMASN
jgi:hypothetical protein